MKKILRYVIGLGALALVLSVIWTTDTKDDKYFTLMYNKPLDVVVEYDKENQEWNHYNLVEYQAVMTTRITEMELKILELQLRMLEDLEKIERAMKNPKIHI